MRGPRPPQRDREQQIDRARPHRLPVLRALAETGIERGDDKHAREGEFGVNYYPKDGLKILGSYGRQFSSAGNLNLWTVGITYRFLIPLGRTGTQ